MHRTLPLIDHVSYLGRLASYYSELVSSLVKLVEQLRQDVHDGIRKHIETYWRDTSLLALEGEDLLWAFLGARRPAQEDCSLRRDVARAAQNELVRTLDFQVRVGDPEARERLSLVHRAAEVLLEDCTETAA
ncbi:hypothetical protein DL765_006887 [Monosporascus sp. GIB2]|nr:hypothetical protein DL765_006887 [Monosporascus sp. GIB2]